MSEVGFWQASPRTKNLLTFKMTRKELHTALLTSGKYHQPNKQHVPLWVQAMELYQRETGDKEVSLACGGCINKIKNWLEK